MSNRIRIYRALALASSLALAGAADVVVDGGRGIEDAAVVTGGAIKKGAEVTMHYSEEGGKKVVLLVKHL